MTYYSNNEVPKKEVLEVLAKECERVGNTISQLDQSSQRILPIAVTLLSIVAGYGIKEKINEIVIALPYLLITVAFYSVHTYTEVVSLGGYRRHLEEQINSILEKDLLIWESSLAPRRHWSISQLFLYVLYTGFLIVASVIGTFQAFLTYGYLVCIIQETILSILAIGLVLAIKRMFSSFNEVYGETKMLGLK